MAIGTGLAILGSAIIGAGAGIISGNKAAKAQKKAAQTAADTERYFYDTSRADFAPWREQGARGLGVYANLLGVNGREAQDQAYADFQTTPGYQFRVDQAMKAIDRRSSAGGYRRAPRAEMELGRYISDYVAGPEYAAHADRLAALAGIGQSAAGQTAAAGAQAASGISAAQMAAGNARASNYQNIGNQINSGIQNVASWYLYNRGLGGGGSGGYGGMAPGGMSPSYPYQVPGFGNA